MVYQTFMQYNGYIYFEVSARFLKFFLVDVIMVWMMRYLITVAKLLDNAAE